MCSFRFSPVPTPRKKRPGIIAAEVAAACAMIAGWILIVGQVAGGAERAARERPGDEARGVEPVRDSADEAARADRPGSHLPVEDPRRDHLAVAGAEPVRADVDPRVAELTVDDANRRRAGPGGGRPSGHGAGPGQGRGYRGDSPRTA